MTLVVAASDLPGAADAVRREIRALRPEQAVSNVQTMSQLLAGDTAAASLLSALLAAFAAAALILATMGLYAVVSLAVGQSTREIGIRMALGAQGRDVVRLILRRWLGLTGAGILAGLAATLLLGRVLSGLLFTRQARRRSRAVGDHGPARRRGDSRQLHPRPPGDAGRSDPGVAGGVSRTALRGGPNRALRRGGSPRRDIY